MSVALHYGRSEGHFRQDLCSRLITREMREHREGMKPSRVIGRELYVFSSVCSLDASAALQ